MPDEPPFNPRGSIVIYVYDDGRCVLYNSGHAVDRDDAYLAVLAALQAEVARRLPHAP